MSCSTATRWFVPDHEFFASDNDYALVGQSENLVRRHIDDGNDDGIPASADGSPEVVVYFDLLFDRITGRRTPCYDFATNRRMLWADVDDSNPEHRSEIQRLAKEKGALKENEYNIIWSEFWPLLNSALKAKSKEIKSKAGKPEMPASESDENEFSQEEKELYLYRRLDEWCNRGRLEPVVFDTLLTGFKTAERRQKMINMLTSQHHSGKSRSIMILIGMVDSLQTSTCGEKQGWAVVYDIKRDLFICKPFFSNEKRHPLTSSWYADVKDDGVSFSWAPRIFIEQYLQLSDILAVKLGTGKIRENVVTDGKETHRREPDLEISGRAFAFRLLLHTTTARFLLTHWSSMVESRSESSKEYQAALYTRVKDAVEKLHGTLRRVRVPVVARTERTDQKLCVRAVEDMQWNLEEQEAYFRECAVQAKEQGHPKAAENVARLYEHVLEMIKAFNADPERKMEI